MPWDGRPRKQSSIANLLTDFHVRPSGDYTAMASNKASFAIQDLLGLHDSRPESESNREEQPRLEIGKAPGAALRPAPTTDSAGRTGKKARKRRRQLEADSGVGDESHSSESDGEPLNTRDSSGSSSSGSPHKSKRLRTAFTVAQLRALEFAFRMCPYPDSYGREQIAKTTSIEQTKIQVWFQNRRARYRKREKPLEQEKHSTSSPHQFPLSPYAQSYSHPSGPPSFSLPPPYFPFPFPYPYYPTSIPGAPSFPGYYPMPVDAHSSQARPRFTGGGKRSVSSEESSD